MAAPLIDVVICTYDNPAQLDDALGSLARQDPSDRAWSVLVVDNNSDPRTAAVVDRWAATGAVPGLRRVRETTQGLTPARRRGVVETSAPWIAFVDDDCVLDPGWMRAATSFAAGHADVGGFGGLVVPRYGRPPPAAVASRGWLFAAQDLGDDVVETDCLVGAGMVLRRQALVASGWVDQQYFADRAGARLVSGGDVELALRVAAIAPLWYVPACELSHRVGAGRLATPYLVRLALGLGVAASRAGALVWRSGRRRWSRAAVGDGVDALRTIVGAVLRAARRGRDDTLLTCAYELGRLLGTARVAVEVATGRCASFGRAAP